MKPSHLFLSLIMLLGLLAAPPHALAEPPECSGSVDKDGDGYTGHPADPDCDSPEDDIETVTGPPHGPILTIRYNPERGRFVGQLIDGDEPRCEPGRRVKVKKVRSGRNLVIGRDESNRRGSWAVPRPKPRGRFYAVAMPEFRYGDSEGVECDRHRSVTIRVP